MIWQAPGFLWLLLAVPIVVWLVPRRISDVRHALLRALVFATVLVGLARPVTLADATTEHVVFVRDVSRSVGGLTEGAWDAAVDRARARGGRDTLRLTRVDVGPHQWLPAEGAPVLDPDPRFDRLLQVENAMSPLAQGLEIAARQVPLGARGTVILCTDGAGTDASHAVATQALTARGIPVVAVPLGALDRGPRAVRVAPRTVLRAGLDTEVEVTVVGAPGATARVALEAGGGDAGGSAVPVGEPLDVTLPGSGRTVVAFDFEPEAAGFVPLRATVTSAEDPITADDVCATECAVQDPLRVLYLGQRVEGGRGRIQELLAGGFELETSESLAGDDGGAGLDRFDLVFVDDRPAEALPEPFQRELVRAVESRGLGLVFAGGKAAFGPGGYEGTALADALPVEFVQKEEKRDPSTTLVVIIDTSGSMGGMRVTLAKEVSRLAMKRLLPHDKVGIVEFYGAKRWAAPIQPASNLIELQRALNRLDAGGGTVILPAIEEAFYGLQNVDTRYKHVLILTDGGVETGAFEPLLRKMSGKGINVSTVLVGPEAHSEFLVTLANWGKGRFYSVPNRFNLPEIILKQPASAQLPAYRPGRQPVRARGGRSWWGEVALDAVPPLDGYVETEARSTALTLLETTSDSAPILATWQYGLGRVTALMTEPTGPGTEGWAAWDEYGTWLGRLCARTARSDAEEFDYELFWRGAPTGPSAVVRATRRSRDGAAQPRARLLDAAAGLELEGFVARSLDVFEAECRRVPESTAIHVLAGSALRLGLPARDGGSPIATELQTDPASTLDLAALAAATGGRVVEDLATLGSVELPVGGAERPQGVRLLWPWAFALAILLFLADLLYRRWPTRAPS